jgi:dTDP-glucose 4,6-dehydratase
MITRALSDQPLPVYGDGQNVRDWLHVTDHASAIWAVCTLGDVADELYNIGGRAEMRNIDVVKTLLSELGKPESLIRYVNDRLGHDRRYAIDNTRVSKQLGWEPKYSFDLGIRETVRWYVSNPDWWRRVESEAYRAANALYINTPGAVVR